LITRQNPLANNFNDGMMGGKVALYSRQYLNHLVLHQSANSEGDPSVILGLDQFTDTVGNTRYLYKRYNGYLIDRAYYYSGAPNVITDQISIRIPSETDFDQNTAEGAIYRYSAGSTSLTGVYASKTRGWKNYDGPSNDITSIKLKKVSGWVNLELPESVSVKIGYHSSFDHDDFDDKWKTHRIRYQIPNAYASSGNVTEIICYDSTASVGEAGYYSFKNNRRFQRVYVDVPNNVDGEAYYELFINDEPTGETVRIFNVPTVPDIDDADYSNISDFMSTSEYLRWLLIPRAYFSDINVAEIWHDMIDELEYTESSLLGFEIPGIGLGLNEITDSNNERVTEAFMVLPDRVVWPAPLALGLGFLVMDKWDLILFVVHHKLPIWEIIPRSLFMLPVRLFATLGIYAAFKDHQWDDLLQFFPTDDGYFSDLNPGTYKDLLLSILFIQVAVWGSRVLGKAVWSVLGAVIGKVIERRGVNLKDIRLLLSSDARVEELTSVTDRVNDWSYDETDDKTLHDTVLRLKDILDPEIGEGGFDEEALAGLFPTDAVWGLPGVLALLKGLVGQELNAKSLARMLSRFL